MKRRSFLAGAAALATSGCLGRAVGNGTTTRDRTTTDRQNTTTDSTTTSGDCPEVRREVAATVCSGEDSDYGAVLSQTAQSVAADGSLGVTLTNESAESVGLNPYAWAVHERTEKGWRHVAPDTHIEPWTVLSQGDSQAWRVQLGDGGTTENEDAVAAGPLDLDAGEHAFSIVAQVDGDRVAFVARFTVE
jgi:hypothetical protein